MSFLTLYDLLGIKENASVEEIARNCKTMLKGFHPDHLANQEKVVQAFANEITKSINQAKDILRDETKRKKYDDDLQNQRIPRWIPFVDENDSTYSEWRKKIRSVDDIQQQNNNLSDRLKKLTQQNKSLTDELEKTKLQNNRLSQDLDREKGFCQQMIADFNKKRKRNIWIYSLLAGLILTGAVAFTIWLNQDQSAYDRVIPVTVDATIPIAGYYSVTSSAEGGTNYRTAEIIETAPNVFSLTVYGDGPAIISHCSIGAAGMIHSDLWGDGEISYKPSNNTIRISFTIKENIIWVFVK